MLAVALLAAWYIYDAAEVGLPCADFFRSERYNSKAWKVLAGLIDFNFVEGDAADTGVSPDLTTCDPAFDVVYHADHLGASIEGVLEWGAPTGAHLRVR